MPACTPRATPVPAEDVTLHVLEAYNETLMAEETRS
jgi:hypothetical protein